MAPSQDNISLLEIRNAILGWLQPRLEDKEYKWIETKSNHLKEGGEDWEFYTAFSAVPRNTGKGNLSFTEQEKKQTEKIRNGWAPDNWTEDQLGRTLIVISIAQSRSRDDFLDILEKTFVSSDIGEAVALYQSFAVLPYPDKLQKRAAEGLRSSIDSIFNAVALHNPYPAEYLDQGAWNQLVLKALFVGSPLYKIVGIDRRRNKKLANMLIDYAHERWAADRSVSPELWRTVGAFAKNDDIQDLEKVLAQPANIQKQAAILALSESPAEKAQAIVGKHQLIQEEIAQQQISWDDIGRTYDE